VLTMHISSQSVTLQHSFSSTCYDRHSAHCAYECGRQTEGTFAVYEDQLIQTCFLAIYPCQLLLIKVVSIRPIIIISISISIIIMIIIC